MKPSSESFQYLEFLRRTRSPRSVGELFVIKFKRKGYIAGRVVANNCAMSPAAVGATGRAATSKYAHLIYIYKHVYKTTKFESPKLVSDLLIPPVICLTGWSQGYFAPLRVEPEGDYEKFPVQCFSFDRYDHRKQQEFLMFCDERGQHLARCYQPCGPLGPYTHRGVEHLIADAHRWPWTEGFSSRPRKRGD